jgi:hypothetical protein
MIKRYMTSRPMRSARQANCEDGPDAEHYLARTVFEVDPTPYQTGLLDAFGDPLWATYEMDPIGFVRHD